MSCRIVQGDCREVLKTLRDGSIQCVVTSPPYWGLRDYGVEGQIGLEETMEEYIGKMVSTFREVHRVLSNVGTCWINLGDTYSGSWGAQSRTGGDNSPVSGDQILNAPKRKGTGSLERTGLKAKDLCGIPWRVAFALQADGWYLRSDIVWSKPNCMPESVTDRPTRSHEYIFLLTKQERYFYDADAIKEPCSESSNARYNQDIENQIGSTRANGGEKTNGNMKAVGGPSKQRGHSRRHAGFNDRWDNMEKSEQCSGMRNKRDVWTVAPANYKEAHFATFPTDLIRPCILAGSRPGETILDPFGGSGTVGEVAEEYGRNSVLIELNPNYIPMIERRTNVTPGLALA